MTRMNIAYFVAAVLGGGISLASPWQITSIWYWLIVLPMSMAIGVIVVRLALDDKN